MATNYKVLGQAALTAETDTDIYTVPASTEAVVSTLTICNIDTSANTFRVAVVPSGETLSNKHYTAYDTSVSASDSVNITIGMTLSAGDKIKGYSGASSTISMTAFGSEIS